MYETSCSQFHLQDVRVQAPCLLWPLRIRYYTTCIILCCSSLYWWLVLPPKIIPQQCGGQCLFSEAIHTRGMEFESTISGEFLAVQACTIKGSNNACVYTLYNPIQCRITILGFGVLFSKLPSQLAESDRFQSSAHRGVHQS